MEAGLIRRRLRSASSAASASANAGSGTLLPSADTPKPGIGATIATASQSSGNSPENRHVGKCITLLRGHGTRAMRKANLLRGSSSLILALLAMLALPPSTTSQTATVADNTNSEPIAYLNRALDEMQLHALRREAVD